MATPNTILVGFQSIGWWLVLAAAIALTFAAEALGYWGCMVVGILPPNALAWACFVATAIIVGWGGAWFVSRYVLQPMQELAVETAELRAQVAGMDELMLQLAERKSQQRKLRHDLRGALSPALLMADRLGLHGDPAVKRSGDIVVRSVENAITLLADAPAQQAVNPPAGP